MTLKEVTDKNEWEDFVATWKPNNFLASWDWGDFSLSLGQPVFRLGLFDEGKLIGCCLAIKVGAKRGSFLLCPAGPLVKSFNPTTIKFFIDGLKKIANRERLGFIRIRPLVGKENFNENLFRSLGFRKSPSHVHAQVSWLLDIKKSEEELLADMRKTTRYLVRQAGKLGVVVEEKNNLEGISCLERLQAETVKRRHFVPFSKEYLEKEFETFVKSDKVKIFLARKSGENLAAAMVVFYGDSAFYHHGASLPTKIPASYLLQWAAIKAAKNLGKNYYNFWGIAPTDSPGHPWAGLSSFKKGFGGFLVEYAWPQDLPLSPFYPLIYWFERLRSYRRGLRVDY